MRRTTWQLMSGLVALAGAVIVMQRPATAHCLSGRGLYECCVQACASTPHRAAISDQPVVASAYRRYRSQCKCPKPVIHRTDKLSARNRNGGIP
jgi:hypothetical protein